MDRMRDYESRDVGSSPTGVTNGSRTSRPCMPDKQIVSSIFFLDYKYGKKESTKQEKED